MKEGGFTFSNGVTIPKGTYVSASMHAAHMNPGQFERTYTKFTNLLAFQTSTQPQRSSTASASPASAKRNRQNTRWPPPTSTTCISDTAITHVLAGELIVPIAGYARLVTSQKRLADTHCSIFAANELKAMLAHLVLHYDVQLEGGSRVKPENEWTDEFACANTKAKVMFRKRLV